MTVIHDLPLLEFFARVGRQHLAIMQSASLGEGMNNIVGTVSANFKVFIALEHRGQGFRVLFTKYVKEKRLWTSLPRGGCGGRWRGRLHGGAGRTHPLLTHFTKPLKHRFGDKKSDGSTGNTLFFHALARFSA
jgi:hypothetical protein